MRLDELAARTHRRRHPGMPGAVVGPDAGLRRWPRKRAGGRPQHRPAAAGRPRGRDPDAVHCLVQRRADGLGANHNAKIFRIGSNDVAIAPVRRAPSYCPNSGRHQPIWCCDAGTASARWAAPTSTRPCATSGSPPSSPSGVSVNVAITNLVMDAVNAGLSRGPSPTQLPGFPPTYADAVIDNTPSCWPPSPPPTNCWRPAVAALLSWAHLL